MILLVTGESPACEHGGEIYLRDLAELCPPGSLLRFSLCARGDERPAKWNGVTLGYATLPREGGVRRFGRAVHAVTSRLVHAWVRLFSLPWLILRLRRFAQGHRLRLLWINLDSWILILLARRAPAALGLPLVVSIPEAPERHVAGFLMSVGAADRLQREFAAVMKSAARWAPVSENMRDDYEARFGRSFPVLRHPVRPEVMAASHAPAPLQNSARTVALIGSDYGHEAMSAFFRALESCGWNVAGHPIRILMPGTSTKVAASMDEWRHAIDSGRITVRGRCSEAEVVSQLSTADVLYLPYWLDPAFLAAAAHCFPVKLSTYVAAGRPILFHGQSQAGAARFIREFGIGVCCPTGDAGAILKALGDALALDPTNVRDRCGHAVRDELAADILTTRFAQFIASA